jgi:peptidoglycan hydrolase CwlO-like protein
MDMNRAVDDLVWLSTRLTGIIALKDVLTDYHTLQNQVNDFKTMVSDLKSRWNELNTSIKDQQREITSKRGK